MRSKSYPIPGQGTRPASGLDVALGVGGAWVVWVVWRGRGAGRGAGPPGDPLPPRHLKVGESIDNHPCKINPRKTTYTPLVKA